MRREEEGIGEIFPAGTKPSGASPPVEGDKGGKDRKDGALVKG